VQITGNHWLTREPSPGSPAATATAGAAQSAAASHKPVLVRTLNDSSCRRTCLP
jgi:hypothetical protein